MTDRIVLSGVSGTGFHGVFDHEKRDGQIFVVDVAIDADLAAAGRSDDLSRTVNYGEIGAVVLERIEGEPFELIERLASVIAQDVLAGHRLVDEVTVTVHKPQAPVGVPFADVTVSVARGDETSAGRHCPGGESRRCPGRPDGAVASIMDLAGVAAVQVSDVVETDPVGGPDQPVYLNQVVTATTWWSAPRLLASLHRIEAEHGRVREIRWGARTLDLDLIQYGTPGMESEWRSESEGPDAAASEGTRAWLRAPAVARRRPRRAAEGGRAGGGCGRSTRRGGDIGRSALAEERTDCGCGAGGCGS